MAYKDLPRLYFVLCNLSDIYAIYVICLYLRCSRISFVYVSLWDYCVTTRPLLKFSYRFVVWPVCFIDTTIGTPQILWKRWYLWNLYWKQVLSQKHVQFTCSLLWTVGGHTLGLKKKHCLLLLLLLFSLSLIRQTWSLEGNWASDVPFREEPLKYSAV